MHPSMKEPRKHQREFGRVPFLAGYDYSRRSTVLTPAPDWTRHQPPYAYRFEPP